MRSTKDNVKAAPEEICYKRQGARPWLIIFHLPAESVWCITLYIVTYLVILESLFSSVNNLCLEGKFNQILLVPDVMYVVDLALTGLVRFVKKLNVVAADLPKCPFWVVLSDIYSLIPQELFYSGEDFRYCLMRSNRAFRVVRLSYVMYKSYHSLNRHILMHIVDFSVIFTLCGFFTYCMYCNSVCSEEKCIGTACDAPNFFTGIICSMQNIDTAYIEDRLLHRLMQCLFVLCVISTGFFFRAFITVHQIHRATHQHIYMYRYKIMKYTHGRYNVPEYIKMSADKGYRLYWQQSRGYRESKHCLAILSPVMASEILIDISWPAFKHSKLFRGMDLPFLREVSKYMKQIDLLPGEIIYRKSQLKEKMIYVVSGTISILSDEDGESPIISFTSGTVVGELSLFVLTKSTNVLQCKTFCQLHILEQRNFLNICSKFPVEYQALRSMINERFVYAKESNKIVLEIKSNLTDVRKDIDIYTTFWLKNILHVLMSIDSEAAYRHNLQNIHLMKEAKQGNLKYLLFCANNLDMLVINERIEKGQDPNFARLKFPYIIHSTSVILNLWEIFIVAWTLLLSFVIPYMVFAGTHLPIWYKPIILFGTITFTIDIYIQISTTIKTPSGVLSTLTTITIRRFQTVGFWMDLFSCLPLEVFNPIVIEQLTANSIAKMHLNRVVKIWRIERLFQGWMHSSTANHILIVFLKFTWILSYITFSVFMYLRYENPDVELLHIIFISSQWTRDLEYTTEGYKRSNIIKPIIQEYVYLTILAFYGSVAFVHVIQHFNFLSVQQISFDLLSMVKTENLKAYSNRVVDFLLAQWYANYCYYLHRHSLTHLYFSKTMLTETIDSMYGDEVRNIPLFQCFTDSFGYDACNIMKLIIFSPKEVICFYGCITKYIYIMLRGSCEMLNESSNLLKVINGTYCCNLIEVMLRSPNTHTFRAVTHCMVLRFDKRKFIKRLFQYEDDFIFCQTLLQSCGDIKKSLINMSKLTTTNLSACYEKNKNFIIFPLNMKKDSLQEYDFYIPYDRLYPCEFLRYFFLRCSFIPDGSFLYIWQWIRSCIVLITAICYFVPIIIIDYPWILHILDILGFVDVYIRLHVCFYNNEGILITHPLETARHYWRNGFLVDFFAILPLRYIIIQKYDWSIILINSNHLLQLHSYLQLMSYIKTDIIKPTSKWCSLFYIPFIMVLCNLLGIIFFLTECTISHDSSIRDDIYIGYSCIPDSVLAASAFSKPISLERAHLYYVYISTSLMTNVAFQGPVISSKAAKCIFMIGLFVGLYISVKLISQMQEMYCFRQGALLENQIAMKHLKKFLDVTVRDSKLKKVVIRTCELKWLRLKGQGVFKVVKPFTLALRTDILYEFYGKTLNDTSPFKGNASLFYKNLLPILKFDLIVKGGYLQTINDIDDNIYILYQGMADVLAPDGTTLQTLQAGSIYGNMVDKSRSRLKLSIIAITHVEVLLCKTKTFLKLLQYYPQIFQQFESLRSKYIYYIPTTQGIVHLAEASKSKSSKNLFTRVLEPNCHFVRVWNFLHLTFACYVGILLDIYQMGSADYSYSLITIQYLCDLLYLSHFLIQDRIAYENEWGYMVYDLAMIKKRNRKRKVMLTITIISMVPTDIFIYSINAAFFNNSGFNSLYRFNRCLRIIYLIEYIRVESKKLDVWIFLMKLLGLIVWAFLIVNTFASLLASVSCSLSPNLSPAVPDWETKVEWNSSELLKLHITFIYTSWSAFSLSSDYLYIPQGSVHIGLFIFTMIAGYYCHMMACCEVFSMVNEFYVKKGQYLKLYHHIKYFLSAQNVSASLRTKCLNICSVLWTTNEGQMFPRLLDEVSPYLRDAAMNCAFSFFVGAHPVFEKCHIDFIRQVIQKLRYRIYYSGEYIQFKGTIDRTMYFVFDGEVHALVDEYMHNDEIVQVLYKGDSFGIHQGLQKMHPHDLTYRCKRTTTILSLYLNEWEYLLTFFPASKQILYKGSESYKSREEYKGHN